MVNFKSLKLKIKLNYLKRKNSTHIKINENIVTRDWWQVPKEKCVLFAVTMTIDGIQWNRYPHRLRVMFNSLDVYASVSSIIQWPMCILFTCCCCCWYIFFYFVPTLQEIFIIFWKSHDYEPEKWARHNATLFGFVVAVVVVS